VACACLAPLSQTSSRSRTCVGETQTAHR
jgi:hypothetical protein